MEYEVVVVARPGLVPQRLTRESLEGTTWIARGRLGDTHRFRQGYGASGYCPSESARAAILRGGRIRAETWLRGFRHQPVCRCSRVARQIAGRRPHSRLGCAPNRVVAPCSRGCANTRSRLFPNLRTQVVWRSCSAASAQQMSLTTPSWEFRRRNVGWDGPAALPISL